MNSANLAAGALIQLTCDYSWYYPRQENLTQQLRLQQLWVSAYHGLGHSIKGDIVMVLGAETDGALGGVFLLVLHPGHGALVAVVWLSDVVLLEEIPTP